MKLPIRLRLTAWYVLLLAVILAGLGAFVVLQLRSDLRQAVDRDIQASLPHIQAGYREGGREDFVDESATALARSGSVAQVIDPTGSIVARYGDTRPGPLAAAAVRARALAGPPVLVTVRPESGGPPYRAVVARAGRAPAGRVIVVAESLASVQDSVRRVLVLLLLGGPAALAATALVGWWVARKALRPVERMASRADEIGIDRLDERVPVPPARDEIAHLAVTLNAMLERLERGVEEQHRLVADASHELRTPLTVMRAELDVSLHGDDLSPEAREVLESVREEVDRLIRTAENLLVLAQIDEGRLVLLPRQVRLADAIETAVRPLRPLADAKRVRLDIDADGYEAAADPQRLNQVLTNFVENAIAFTPPGGAVRVTAWQSGDEVGVTVADDGPGIPAEAQSHVFDRFFRVDGSRTRTTGGSGLGLAICREIAVAHGGRVRVQSVVGRGSAFSIALPRHRAGNGARGRRRP
ncbi:MAG TPA: ATP-binding protein, partial [Solirubrobacteraceae bacterium]|nr:ATP-binding protein [Solirubrobacteraceae bacterium]